MGVDSTLLTFLLGPLENSISEKSTPKGPEFLTLFDSGWREKTGLLLLCCWGVWLCSHPGFLRDITSFPNILWMYYRYAGSCVSLASFSG